MDSEAPTNLQHKIPLTEQPTPVNSLVFAGRGAKLKTFIFDINIQNQANQLLELRTFRGCACETRSVFCQIASTLSPIDQGMLGRLYSKQSEVKLVPMAGNLLTVAQ